VLDSGYRGEVSFKFKQTCGFIENEEGHDYSIGERVGQIIILPYPQINFIEVDELSSTERGEGGYGSTGK